MFPRGCTRHDFEREWVKFVEAATRVVAQWIPSFISRTFKSPMEIKVGQRFNHVMVTAAIRFQLR